MIDPNEFAALSANARSYHDQQAALAKAKAAAAAQQPSKRKGKGGTLTSLISEGSSGTGALIGGALGTAVGPVGTVVGAGIGGAIGGFLGRLGENKVRDDRWGLSDALSEGAMSGVMSAGPGQLLKAGKYGLSAVAGKGAAKAANPVTTLADALAPGAKTAGQAATGEIVEATAGQATQQPLKMSTSGKLLDKSNSMLLSEWPTVPARVARQTDPKRTVSSLADMDIIGPENAERIATGVTGRNGLVSNAVARAVDGAGPADLSHMPGVITKAVSKRGYTADVAKGLEAEINASMELVDPAQASTRMAAIRDLEEKAAEYVGKGNTHHLATSDDKKRAAALLEVARKMEDDLYQGGANANIAAQLTPEFRDQLIALHPTSAKWTQQVERLMQSKNVKDLRSFQSPFVKARNLIDEGELNAVTMGGRVGNAAANGQIMSPTQAAIATTYNAVKNPANRVAGKVTRKLAAVAPGAVESGAKTAPTSLAAALGNVGPVRQGFRATRNLNIGNAAEAMLTPGADIQAAGIDPQAGGMYEDGTPVDPAQAQVGMTGTGGAVANPTTFPGQQQPTDVNPFAPENIQASMQKLVANGGTDQDLMQFLSMAKAMQELSAPAGGADLDSNTRKAMAMSANAENTITNLESLYSNAGGAQGKLGGGLANILGRVGQNDNAQSYNEIATSTVTQLAKALAGGGQVSDADAAALIKSIPLITDNPATAQAKFNYLKNQLATARQNAMLYGAGAADDITAQSGAY